MPHTSKTGKQSEITPPKMQFQPFLFFYCVKNLISKSNKSYLTIIKSMLFRVKNEHAHNESLLKKLSKLSQAQMQLPVGLGFINLIKYPAKGLSCRVI